MKTKISFILSLIMISMTLQACGGGAAMVANGPTVAGDGSGEAATPTPTAQAYVKNFHNQAQSLGLVENSLNLTYQIVDPSLTSQLPTKLVGNVFYINSSSWLSLNNNCQKEMFLFREMGRWVLNRNYVTSQSSNVNSSLMNPGGFSCDLYVSNYAYFMRELFTQTYLSFSSNPSANQKAQGYLYFNALYSN